MAKPKPVRKGLNKYEYLYTIRCPICRFELTFTSKDVRRETCYRHTCQKCLQDFKIATRDSCLLCHARLDCLLNPSTLLTRRRVRSDAYRQERKAQRRVLSWSVRKSKP